MLRVRAVALFFLEPLCQESVSRLTLHIHRNRSRAAVLGHHDCRPSWLPAGNLLEFRGIRCSRPRSGAGQFEDGEERQPYVGQPDLYRHQVYHHRLPSHLEGKNAVGPPLMFCGALGNGVTLVVPRSRLPSPYLRTMFKR